MSLRVLIAEDHTLVSEGFEVMLSITEDVELAGAVSSGDAPLMRQDMVTWTSF